MKYSYSTCGFYNPAIHKSVPDDAVDLTPSQYRALLEGLSRGLAIEADVNGQPILMGLPADAPTVEELCQCIDAAADAARARVVGDPLRALEYDRARIEAEAFAAADYQGEVPPMVAAWAINGRTAREATDDIRTEAFDYIEALYRVRAIRLAAKESLRSLMDKGMTVEAQHLCAAEMVALQTTVTGVGNA